MDWENTSLTESDLAAVVPSITAFKHAITIRLQLLPVHKNKNLQRFHISYPQNKDSTANLIKNTYKKYCSSRTVTS